MTSVISWAILTFAGVLICWLYFMAIADRMKQHRLTRCGLMFYTPKDQLQTDVQAWVDYDHCWLRYKALLNTQWAKAHPPEN